MTRATTLTRVPVFTFASTFIFMFSLMFSMTPAQASVENSWALKTGKKHPLFESGETTKTLEEKVFSEEVSFEKRWRLVDETAGLKKKPEALSFLKKCLKSKVWFLESAALKTLQKRYPQEALDQAKMMLFNSKALVVRSEAVSVITSLGGPEDTEKLWKALNQKQNFKRRFSLWIRPQIVKSIYKLERSKHSERWADLLSDSSAEIREIAKKVVALN